MQKLLVPLDLEKLGGPFREVDADIDFEKNGRGIASFDNYPNPIPWIKEQFGVVWFQRMGDGVAKAIRLTTNEDFRRCRVPIWRQSAEQPSCCGQPMFYVGQFDDDALCAEPPVGAKMWWHDSASFYVFTCPICLGVKAVGQQY